MRYTVDERHDQIIRLVRASGTLRVTELADRLGISTVTARRDVEALAAQGRLDRVRGAVSWPGAQVADTQSGTDRPPARTPQQAPAGLTLGMVVPQSRHYFSEIIRGAREASDALGARLVLGFSGYETERDVAEAERMRAMGADGLLLTPSWLHWDDPAQSARLDFGLPAVVVERDAAPGSQAASLDRISSDHAAGAGLAVRHLAALGRRAITLVAGISHTATLAEAGYRSALTALGLTAPAPMLHGLYGGVPDTEVLSSAGGQLADAVRRGEVDAALVVGDEDAMYLLQTLRTHGVSVPQDMALIAYGDDLGDLSELPLTAVAPPKYQVGRMAVELLVQRIREQVGAPAGAPDSRRHLSLLPRLQVRESCGAETTDKDH